MEYLYAIHFGKLYKMKIVKKTWRQVQCLFPDQQTPITFQKRNGEYHRHNFIVLGVDLSQYEWCNAINAYYNLKISELTKEHENVFDQGLKLYETK